MGAHEMILLIWAVTASTVAFWSLSLIGSKEQRIWELQNELLKLESKQTINKAKHRSKEQ